MIRHAVVHLLSEQPIVVDLLEMPSPGDVSIICRNVRTLDGKRPVFIDRSEATFVFPYASVRFVEIPRSSVDVGEEPAAAPEVEQPVVHEPDDLEIDEEFLRKIREA